jgi:predicted transcriptional regulator
MRALAVAMQDHRADLHLTVDELAAFCHVPVSTMWSILAGSRPDDAPADAVAVARLEKTFTRTSA